ncbi:MAG: GIY-YIG nuclease family protein [Pseudomonadota bacterium]
MPHYVYIMASRPGSALYTGRTTDLRHQVETHRLGHSEHTAKYNIHTLVWFEAHDDFATSLRRERAIKRWRRPWKDALIATDNPHWTDISHAIPS